MIATHRKNMRGKKKKDREREEGPKIIGGRWTQINEGGKTKNKKEGNFPSKFPENLCKIGGRHFQKAILFSFHSPQITYKNVIKKVIM